MSIVSDAVEGSSNPVFDGGCDPALLSVYAAGQIVIGQLFVTVNVADSQPESLYFSSHFHLLEYWLVPTYIEYWLVAIYIYLNYNLLKNMFADQILNGLKDMDT